MLPAAGTEKALWAFISPLADPSARIVNNGPAATAYQTETPVSLLAPVTRPILSGSQLQEQARNDQAADSTTAVAVAGSVPAGRQSGLVATQNPRHSETDAGSESERP